MFGFGGTKVPSWAQVLNAKDYEKFIKSVEEYFKQTGKMFVVGDGIVKLSDEDFEFGLSNLVQLCSRNTPKDYPAIVSHHFELIMEGRMFEEKFNKISEDFEQAKQYIGVRLYDEEYVNVMGKDSFIKRHFAGELFEVLVWDFPTTLQNVQHSIIDKWNVPIDMLFEVGKANIKQNYEIIAQKIEIGDGDSIFCAEAEHFFVTNILFELVQYPEFIGKGGMIFAVPTRSIAMIYPVADMKVVNVLSKFFINVPRFYDKGPGSLTREIYWYHDGTIETLNYSVDGDKVQFTPSETFMALLNGGLK